jgi:hypothetical protein
MTPPHFSAAVYIRGIRKSVAGLWQKYTPFYGFLWGSMGVLTGFERFAAK